MDMETAISTKTNEDALVPLTQSPYNFEYTPCIYRKCNAKVTFHKWI